PLGCAVAAETLKIFKDEKILEMINEKSSYLEKKAKEIFTDHENIGEYRQIGLIGAIELVKDRKTKEYFPSSERATYQIYKIGLEKGIIIRPLGNVIYFMPPYIIQKDEIDLMLTTCLESINEFLNTKKKSNLNPVPSEKSFIGFEV
ncbi:MAG: aminotransferase class III-fold pyridoxal phosphate-dependent enzyme, partial [Fusobacteriaceae bacterium]